MEISGLLPAGLVLNGACSSFGPRLLLAGQPDPCGRGRRGAARCEWRLRLVCPQCPVPLVDWRLIHGFRLAGHRALFFVYVDFSVCDEMCGESS